MRRILLALTLVFTLLAATTTATAASSSTYTTLDIPCILGCY